MRPAQSGRPIQVLTIVALFGLLAALAAPAVAIAAEGQFKLALLPLGESGPYFDIHMTAGETRAFHVQIANNGDAAVAARTYAADVYTIINGGFAGRLRDQSTSGSTLWLDYPTGVVNLPAGSSITRAFTVAVPRTTGPGEYITSILLENDKPIGGTGAVALSQITRQAIALVVTVPGPRYPALAIGKASHTVVAGKSVVDVAVENPGNVRLKPVATFVLFDAAANRISEATVPMDTFFAHTATFIEVPLAALLLAGQYTVRLTLDDAAQGVRAEESTSFIVEAPPAGLPRGPDTGPTLTQVFQAPTGAQVTVPLWGFILGGLLVVAIVGTLVLTLRRRRQDGMSAR